MRFLAAWIVGALAYFAAAVASYDGLLSFVFQPVAAALVSAVFVLGAFLLGLPLRLSPIRPLWHCSAWGVSLALGLAALGVTLLIFCLCPGQLIEHVDPATEEHILVTRSVGLLASGYFALIFSVANWPDPCLSRQIEAQPSA